ncbi:hypothetical protein [Streptococcus devriesei]|uniref:hypothetical protein n=1 Tax=Streptococcus devriesei TaxID=231233 RepID=UPI000688068C|nr:hypothetical protein [Streptococcus devriesei]
MEICYIPLIVPALRNLKHKVDIKEQLFKLLHAVEENQFLQLSPEYFSRKLLKYLLDIGDFKPTQWNNNDPKNDYQFMLDMFNKRRGIIL